MSKLFPENEKMRPLLPLDNINVIFYNSYNKIFGGIKNEHFYRKVASGKGRL